MSASLALIVQTVTCFPLGNSSEGSEWISLLEIARKVRSEFSLSLTWVGSFQQFGEFHFNFVWLGRSKEHFLFGG